MNHQDVVIVLCDLPAKTCMTPEEVNWKLVISNEHDQKQGSNYCYMNDIIKAADCENEIHYKNSPYLFHQSITAHKELYSFPKAFWPNLAVSTE